MHRAPGRLTHAPAEGLQAEMGKPESERSEAGKDLTDMLHSRWDDFRVVRAAACAGRISLTPHPGRAKDR